METCYPVHTRYAVVRLCPKSQIGGRLMSQERDFRVNSVESKQENGDASPCVTTTSLRLKQAGFQGKVDVGW